MSIFKKHVENLRDLKQLEEPITIGASLQSHLKELERDFDIEDEIKIKIIQYKKHLLDALRLLEKKVPRSASERRNLSSDAWKPELNAHLEKAEKLASEIKGLIEEEKKEFV